jgi:hypothetical protein
MNPVEVPVNDDVVELVAVLVPVTVASPPVTPAKIPVPPVNSVTIVTSATPPPITVPLSVKVPKSVPSEKTSTKVPLDMNVVRLVKVRVPMFVVVNGPDNELTPEPVKLESKTPSVEVGVVVEVPVSVPVDAESARTGTARQPNITKAIKAAATERIIVNPPGQLPAARSFLPGRRATRGFFAGAVCVLMQVMSSQMWLLIRYGP